MINEILNKLYLSGDRGDEPVFSINTARIEVMELLLHQFEDIGSELHPEEVIDIISATLTQKEQSDGQV